MASDADIAEKDHLWMGTKQPVAPPLLYTGRSGSIIASLIHVRYSDRSHKSDGGRAIYEMAG